MTDADPSLDRIAATLADELEAELRATEQRLADAAGLLRVAGLLPDSPRVGELQVMLDAAAVRREALDGALRWLRCRSLSPPDDGDPDEPEPLPDPGPRDTACSPASPMLSPPVEPARQVLPAAVIAGEIEAAPMDRALAPAALRPAAVAWVARPVELLDQEREGIAAALAALDGVQLGNLARVKGLMSQYRGAQEERRRRPGSQDDWRVLEAALRDRARGLWPNHYCFPLNPQLLLIPDRWYQLGRFYADLGVAIEAFDWVESCHPHQTANWLAREGAPLLETIGAASSRLFHWLQEHLPRQREPQQDDLYRRLRDLSETHRLYLSSLQPADRVNSDELDRLAAGLLPQWNALRAVTERKQAQEETLAYLLSLVAAPTFGSAEEDEERLCQAAAACLEAGLPPSNKTLREALLPFDFMLEDDPRLGRLRKVIADEIQRRGLSGSSGAAGSGTHGDSVVEVLTGELDGKRSELLGRTRGLKGVMVGGICREDCRRAIEQALDLAHLKWPETDPADPFSRIAREIAHADLVFLNRFNRKSCKETIRVCRDDGKILIRLPSGYGLNQVIAQAHAQMFARGGSVPG